MTTLSLSLVDCKKRFATSRSKERRGSCDESGGVGSCRVSVVPAGVNSVLEHNYWREVVSDAGVVLDVVEPPRYVHVLLLLLDDQVHLGERRERLRVQGKALTSR